MTAPDEPLYFVLDGVRYRFTGALPKVGECVAGFVVWRIVGDDFHLRLPKTDEEADACRKWEEERYAHDQTRDLRSTRLGRDRHERGGPDSR